MESTLLQLATIFTPNEGKTFSFLGNSITCKFNPDACGWRFFELIATEDNSVPLHSHPWDEVSYLLTGEVDIQIEEQIVRVTPGYFINPPAGAAHAFTVRSPQVKLFGGGF